MGIGQHTNWGKKKNSIGTTPEMEAVAGQHIQKPNPQQHQGI